MLLPNTTMSAFLGLPDERSCFRQSHHVVLRGIIAIHVRYNPGQVHIGGVQPSIPRYRHRGQSAKFHRFHMGAFSSV